MSKYNDILPQIQKSDLRLKLILDEVSKMRVKCAQMQLEILSLYKPECLEILELLREIEQDPYSFNETPSVQKSYPFTNNAS
ncbi:hypothetical protein KPH14_001107 [Odynerus spinipes]|uniref:Uncharacterized protein n=1 Tax=Odynerus spinipes TaxID=1348599 RepID=A0AAD9RDP4_9HYME|nr:hypothetical protein KPH14_001107 [Odynerus spinipes]